MSRERASMETDLIRLVTTLLRLVAGAALAVVVMIAATLLYPLMRSRTKVSDTRHFSGSDNAWSPPGIERLTGPTRDTVLYGRELISNTSAYLGPNGTVQHLSNGLNCQNCHLAAGTKAFGNNFSAVASTYPKLRARSGKVESIPSRVNDCFQRSLNGEPLDSNSKEMKAIVAYIQFLGTTVKKGTRPEGAGILDLPFLPTPADSARGRALYEAKCTVCHGQDGGGLLNGDGTAYTYPPVWGTHSYNTGAGLFRLSRLAGFIKANMPLGATHVQPQLTDEEAWHIAAFINSMPRPEMDVKNDWPSIAEKPIDHPFGPYADTFSERQHKYGPFGPIAASKNKKP